MLSLNFKTSHFIQFKKKSFNELVIEHNNKLITDTSNLKFLGITTDNTLSWKGQIDKTKTVPRLSQGCYIIRVVKPFLSQDVLKMIYYAYSHSVMIYGLLLCRNSSHSIEVLRLQTKIITIITEAKSRDFCREFFKILGILPLTAQYTYSMTVFVVNNWEYFTENSKLYDIKTRNNKNLFQRQSNLSIKGVLFMLESRYVIIFLFK